MSLTTEIIRALHFILLLFSCFSLMLWVQEEFESILKRKKIVGIGFLQISFFKKVFENNNLKKSNLFKTLFSFLRLFFTFAPLTLLPFSDEIILFGDHFRLGLIENKNSLLIFVFFMMINEIIRPLSSTHLKINEKSLLLFIIFLASFLLVGKFYNFNEVLEYQRQYTEFGMRKYLIYINPIGALTLFQIIINEIDSPSDSFDIVKLSTINGYIILFIFCFLGGYSAPTLFSLEDRSVLNSVICILSFMSKYIFTLVSIWVYRYVFVKRKREMVFNEY
ncbi:MAG: hypothetical protein CME63_18470 [Halobacteriovoraceae bacterium]|nr:hypothetical protein [Halobacteriovoraceae bacterium]|tara:strand:+ start:154105 stop:154938 length:834 start_codon:yes stop_codon:yes gene_type:complete